LTSFEGWLVLRNRTSGIVILASLPFLAGAVIASAVFGTEAFLFGSYALGPVVIALAHHLGWVRPRTRPARIEVSPRSVSVDGAPLRRRIARARIMLQPPGRGVVVEIARRFDPYPARVGVLALDDARSLVRALGLDPREGRSRFRTPLSTFASGAVVLCGTLASAVLLPTLGFPAGFLVLLLMVIALVRFCAQTITIGQDGVLIEGFPRKRFIPYANVISLEREVRENSRGPMMSRGFWLNLADERVFIDTTRERLRDHMFEGDHVFEAAKEAHALARTKQPRAADLLARGGRPMKEWLVDLAGAREARYRVAAIADEELALVLANPSADKTARAGAAICLARAGEEARVQVRVAAEDIAQPDVRAAALAALEDDEEALAAALEALE